MSDHEELTLFGLEYLQLAVTTVFVDYTRTRNSNTNGSEAKERPRQGQERRRATELTKAEATAPRRNEQIHGGRNAVRQQLPIPDSARVCRSIDWHTAVAL